MLFKELRSKSVATSDAQLKIIRQWKALKKRVANYLQRESELLSVKAKKYSLIFFCLLFGGSSTAVIIHSAKTKTQPISITKISKPEYSIQDEKNFLETDSSITKQEYSIVEQFKNYLFQLQTDSSGRKKFDSIMQARPRLMDSINLFEKMYLQQK